MRVQSSTGRRFKTNTSYDVEVVYILKINMYSLCKLLRCRSEVGVAIGHQEKTQNGDGKRLIKSAVLNQWIDVLYTGWNPKNYRIRFNPKQWVLMSLVTRGD